MWPDYAQITIILELESSISLIPQYINQQLCKNNFITAFDPLRVNLYQRCLSLFDFRQTMNHFPSVKTIIKEAIYMFSIYNYKFCSEKIAQ